MTDNEEWSNRIIRRWDPAFQHRWVVYRETLEGMLTPETTWLDIGCGDGGIVGELKHRAGLAVGADVRPPSRVSDGMFVCCDLRSLPFRSGVADLVTLRFVVEHLASPADLQEVVRVLKPQGRLLVLTTNAISPFIVLPRLLPFGLKQGLLTSLYNLREEEVFPTYHRFNSEKVMRTCLGELELVSVRYLQDANYIRRWMFVPFFAWHLITLPRMLQKLRTNILALFVKRTLSAGAPLRT